MSKILQKISKLLIAVAVVALNIFMVTASSGVLVVRLLDMGFGKWSTYAAGLAFSIFLFAYIFYNHKILQFFKNQGNDK